MNAEPPAASPCDVNIGFPVDFRDLPLAGSKQWDADAEHLLSAVSAERPPQYRDLALQHLRAYSQLLAAGGVVKAAACIGTSGGAMSTAAVLVSWVPAASAAPSDVAAAGLCRALAEQHPDREVVAIELPAGPAVAVIAERWLENDAASSDGGEPVRIPIRSIEVSIPLNDQPWTLVVALSSPTPADWENYQQIMAEICRSVSFGPTDAQ